jgi:hypothetical protein
MCEPRHPLLKVVFYYKQSFLMAISISHLLKGMKSHRLLAKPSAYGLLARHGFIKSTFTWIFFWCGNDPSAGSPTETLLRLHLPLNGEVRKSSHRVAHNEANNTTVPISHRVIQSVGATGGVYKGQGRNQCKLMTCVY